MQCKLCHNCWLYWKKYGGLKVPSRIGKKFIFNKVRNVNIIHETSKGKANWIGHILRRNCLLKKVIEGKIKKEKDREDQLGRSCQK